ncbi:MAG: hypothetical protein ABIS86_14560 [Streptosporangiaceae bacterium]
MSTEPSAGTKIATALRRTPVYFDPSLASALPAAKRTELLAAIGTAPMKVFVVVVPLVKGGTWDEPEQLVTVVHDRLGRDGVYLTLGTTGRQLEARQFGGTRESQRDSESAARIPFFLPEMDEATLADRLIKAVELVAAGGGQAAYEKATAYLHSSRPSARPGADGGEDGGTPVVPIVAGVVGAAVVGLVVWRWRRSGQVARVGHPLLLPRAALAAADEADADGLRAQAGQEVVTFGELLETTEVDTSASRVHDLMTLALDAYQAAAKTLDAATGVPDLAGVLVLIDQGRDALASARSLAGGGKEIPPGPLCFFNPLHGDSATVVNWRELGSRDRLRVQACRACARAVRDHHAPQALADRVDGRTVPYYAAQSLWARTGYGQFGDDLVQRVLRGDLRR